MFSRTTIIKRPVIISNWLQALQDFHQNTRHQEENLSNLLNFVAYKRHHQLLLHLIQNQQLRQLDFKCVQTSVNILTKWNHSMKNLERINLSLWISKGLPLVFEQQQQIPKASQKSLSKTEIVCRLIEAVAKPEEEEKEIISFDKNKVETLSRLYCCSRSLGIVESHPESVALYLFLLSARIITQQNESISEDEIANAKRLLQTVPENLRTKEMMNSFAKVIHFERTMSTTATRPKHIHDDKRIVLLDTNVVLLFLFMEKKKRPERRSFHSRSASFDKFRRTFVLSSSSESTKTEIVLPDVVRRELIAWLRRHDGKEIDTGGGGATASTVFISRNIILERLQKLEHELKLGSKNILGLQAMEHHQHHQSVSPNDRSDIELLELAKELRQSSRQVVLATFDKELRKRVARSNRLRRKKIGLWP